MFPDHLDFKHSVELKKKIGEMLSSQSSVYLDFQNVNRVNFACIQVILAAQKQAAKDDIAIAIQFSKQFKTILDQLGLSFMYGEERV